MKNSKYIINYLVCDFCPILFPSYIQHDAMVRHLGLEPKDIDSAGFVDVRNNGQVMCYGESTSLRKASKPKRDQDIISRMGGF